MAVLVVLLLLVLGWFLTSRKRKSKAPLPPSPPADPFLGHLRYIPAENQEIQFTKWAKTYGDVMSLKILNRHIIVLSSTKAAVDLLDKRSANYSDRPPFPIFELMGWGDAMTFIPYGKKFQRHRQLFQEYFNSAKVATYADMQTTQARHLALMFAKGDQDREHILQKFGSAVVVQIAYGHDMFHETDSTYDNMMKNSKRALTSCGPPGGTPVDLFPILRYLPSWFPGTFYANRARECSESTRRMHDYPIEQTLQKLAEGRAKPSFLAHHLDRLQQEGEQASRDDFLDVRGAAGAIFAAGAETVWSSLSIFVLAMVLYPECQTRAQHELDRLLSLSRLPTFADRKSLPYIDNILQETYRWAPAVPLGVPHRTLKDDVYQGMFIPKGAVVFANAWGMSRDERVYHDPSCFNPSRYQTKAEGGNEEPFPVATFGFGRRICPGLHLADTNLWIAFATMLTLFKIEKVKNENGEDIVPQAHMQTGLTSHPKPYQCIFRVRNDAAKALLGEIETELAVMN